MITTTTFITGGTLASLSSVWGTLVTGYVGPLLLAMIAIIAIRHLAKGEVRPLIVDLCLAAAVAVVVYGGAALFGPGSGIVQSGTHLAQQVN